MVHLGRCRETIGKLLRDRVSTLKVPYDTLRDVIVKGCFLGIYFIEKNNLGYNCLWDTLSLFMKFKGNQRETEGTT